MHHALEIQEILCKIFHPFSPPAWRSSGSTADSELIEATSSLAALARTCRTFKDPALDLLWRALADLSPLARCLPDVSCRSFPEDSDMVVRSFDRFVTLTQPLTRAEWEILQSYTRRIRTITSFDVGLDWESVSTFLNPPTTDPLFPNLRFLRCRYTEKSMRLLHLPLPSLVHLSVVFEDPECFQSSSESFPNFSPSLTRLFIHMRSPDDTFGRVMPNYFSRWKNLSSVLCPQVVLDTDDLAHLSRMPALASLNFALGPMLPRSHSPPVFPKLRDLTLRHESLEPVSRFLSLNRLPAIAKLYVEVYTCPSRKELSFFTGVLESGVCDAIQSLRLDQWPYCRNAAPRSETLSLSFDDMRPYTAFSNLRDVKIDIACNVSLTDDGVLALASAWPNLQYFLVNEDWGWNTSGGITPGGLLRLLEMRPSLYRVALRLDARGYTQVPASHVLASDGLASVRVSIDVLDSAVEAECVQALTAFFCGVALACCGPYFSLHAWNGTPMTGLPNMDEYSDRWGDILHRVDDVLGRCSECGD